MSREDLPILNMSNPKHVKVLVQYIKGLKGDYRFEFIKCRNSRSNAQNRFLHGVLFPCAARGLSDLWGYDVSMLDAKEHLKEQLLRTPRIHPETGECLGEYTKGTADLDVSECTAFIDRAREWCLDKLDVYVPEPNEYEVVA